MEGAELVAGAALGALLGELLKRVINLMEKAINFKPVLAEIKSQVEFLLPLMKQVDELGEDFQLEYSNTLKEVVHQGKQLIMECDAAKQRFLKYHKFPSYTKRLRKLDAQLERASLNLLLQLSVQHMKKLQTLEINNNRHGRPRLLASKIVDKGKIVIKKIFMGESSINNNDCSCGLHGYVPNYPTTKLPLLFYHDKRLKGKTGLNFVDALVGRAVEHIKDDSKKVINYDMGYDVEGRIEEKIKKWGEDRFERIFHRTFETTIVGDEKLKNWFACDLSITTERDEQSLHCGVLFVSTAKLAFCSLNHTSNSNNTKSLYLKIVIPFELLKGVEFDEEEEYIQLISIDNQKFGFIKFRNYNDTQKYIQDIHMIPPACTRCTRSLSSFN